MSSYIHFYLRNENNFIPIGTWSRSCKFYEVFDNMPYEHISLLSYNRLVEYQEYVREAISASTKNIEKYEKSIERVFKFENNSATEKEELIDTYEEGIEFEREEIEQYNAVNCFINFLKDIIHEQSYSDYSEDCIYAGIECYKPTIEDIQE